MDYEVGILIDEINRGLTRNDWAYAPAGRHLPFSLSVRNKAERHYRELGHETKRRKILDGGRIRADGLWVRRLNT